MSAGGRPAMPAAQVSVVIRCCNEEEHIGRLLSGILEQSVTNVDIVVVDSGSTDATLAIASRYAVTVRHIGRHEFTFGRALHCGCAAARSEYIVIASAHVYPVYRDWLAKMLAPFSDADIGLLYGQQRGDGRVHPVVGRRRPTRTSLPRRTPGLSRRERHPYPHCLSQPRLQCGR